MNEADERNMMQTNFLTILILAGGTKKGKKKSRVIVLTGSFSNWQSS